MELVQISFTFVCTIIPISLHLFCCYVSICPSVGAQHWWWERVRLDRWALDPIFSVLRGGWCVGGECQLVDGWGCILYLQTCRSVPPLWKCTACSQIKRSYLHTRAEILILCTWILKLKLKFKSWRIIQPLDIDQNEMVIIPDNFLKYKYSAK